MNSDERSQFLLKVKSSIESAANLIEMLDKISGLIEFINDRHPEVLLYEPGGPPGSSSKQLDLSEVLDKGLQETLRRQMVEDLEAQRESIVKKLQRLF